jgi:hypothetical protein
LSGALLAILFAALPLDPGGGEDIDHFVVLAVGPSAEVDVGAPAFQAGGEVSVEFDAVEKWLELELGVQGLGGRDGVAASIDLLFKMPFSLGRRLSVMPGLGPQVVWIVQKGQGSTALGLEIAADLMWWIFSDRVGLGAEPTLGFTFGRNAETSVGLTIGPIVGW